MAAVAYRFPAARRPATRPRPVSRAGRGGSRPYVRRRLVAAAVAAAAVWVLAVALAGAVRFLGDAIASTSPSAPDAGHPARVHVVQPGDTFWSIARTIDPKGDPRPLVDRLVAEHGTPVLYAGEELLIPSQT